MRSGKLNPFLPFFAAFLGFLAALYLTTLFLFPKTQHMASASSDPFLVVKECVFSPDPVGQRRFAALAIVSEPSEPSRGLCYLLRLSHAPQPRQNLFRALAVCRG
jgi:hypothetical protein